YAPTQERFAVLILTSGRRERTVGIVIVVQGQGELLDIIHRLRAAGDGARASCRARDQLADCFVVFAQADGQSIADDFRCESRHERIQIQFDFLGLLGGKFDSLVATAFSAWADDASGDCTTIWVENLGFVTTPTAAHFTPRVTTVPGPPPKSAGSFGS